jgi:hypothetical protein
MIRAAGEGSPSSRRSRWLGYTGVRSSNRGRLLAASRGRPFTVSTLTRVRAAWPFRPAVARVAVPFAAFPFAAFPFAAFPLAALPLAALSFAAVSLAAGPSVAVPWIWSPGRSPYWRTWAAVRGMSPGERR